MHKYIYVYIKAHIRTHTPTHILCMKYKYEKFLTDYQCYY